MLTDRPRLLRRVSLYYFLSYGALGWLFPQLPILIERALGRDLVGAVMVSYPVFGLLSAPCWGIAADRQGSSVNLLVWSTAALAPLVLLYGTATSLPALVAITATFGILRSPQATLADALAHAALEGQHHLFSRCRIWGSVGFVLLAALSGALGGVESGPLYLALPSLAYGCAALVIAGAFEPRDVSHRLGIGREVFAVLRRPALWSALSGLFVYYSGHALFDAYFALHFSALGLPPGGASMAWSFGGLVEIVVMLFAPALLSRVQGRCMLAPVSLVAALRWWLTSWVRPRALLVAVQGLHGFSFGLWYLSIVNHLQAVAPRELRASVQGLTMMVWGAAGVTGYGFGALMLLRGPTASLYRWAALFAVIAAAIFTLVPAARSGEQ